MSSVVISVLNVTFGLLWNKVRDHTVEKLKEGDVTDEKVRKLIVRELDDIKSKLDGLARKDLLSSVEFLKEGMSRLQICVDRLTDDGSSSMAEPVQYEGLPLANLDLGEAMTRLKITSEDRFKLAKESFKAAREEATRAFSNEALSTQDRIFATKLRITSSIMENLENPEIAVTDAKMYLKALHGLPAIKEAFSVHLDGGIKSLFKKSKRHEILQSVRMINSVLYDFTRRFTKMTPDLFDWPEIELEQRTYHPLSVDESIPLGDFDVGRQGALKFQFGGKFEIHAWLSAVNSKGEIITFEDNDFSVINGEGECRIFCSLPSEDASVPTAHWIKALAVDEDDNVYIVSWSEATDPATRFSNKHMLTLFVFDSNGNIKRQCSLDFFSDVEYGFFRIAIAINKEKKIAMTVWNYAVVYICDDSGQLKGKFDLDYEYFLHSHFCCSADTNEIILGSSLHNTVVVYTEEGKLKRKIKLPESHSLLSVAFNYITKNIVVVTCESGTVYLLNYSETDTPQCLWLCNGDPRGFMISSHPNGHVVLMHRVLGIAYI